jgi:hypothetical protein
MPSGGLQKPAALAFLDYRPNECLMDRGKGWSWRCRAAVVSVADGW